MAVNLSKGQKISLDKGMTLALVGLGWDTNRYSGGAEFDLDASAFLLGANGKVRKDEDFIFYGNLKSADGSVTHTGDNRTGEGEGDDEVLYIDFTKVPADVERIAITVTIYEAQERGQNFGRTPMCVWRAVPARTIVSARKNCAMTLARTSPWRRRWWCANCTAAAQRGSSTPSARAIRAACTRCARRTA